MGTFAYEKLGGAADFPGYLQHTTAVLRTPGWDGNEQYVVYYFSDHGNLTSGLLQRNQTRNKFGYAYPVWFNKDSRIHYRRLTLGPDKLHAKYLILIFQTKLKQSQ